MATIMTVKVAGGALGTCFLWAHITMQLGFCREAQALASNADISRRKAERKAQKLDKDRVQLQSLLKLRDR